jgi:hypothetical protein
MGGRPRSRGPANGERRDRARHRGADPEQRCRADPLLRGWISLRAIRRQSSKDGLHQRRVDGGRMASVASDGRPGGEGEIVWPSASQVLPVYNKVKSFIRMLRIGADASDFPCCYFWVELCAAPDASRAAVPKESRPWCYESSRHSERSEASALNPQHPYKLL